MKSIVWVIGPLVFLLHLTSPTQGQERKSSWKTKWEKTLQAAKQEGQINIYGGEEINHPVILKVFSDRYPDIKIVTVSGHSEVIQRVVAERRARKYLVDVYSLGPGSVRTAYMANFLQPVRPDLMLPEVTDTSGWYRGQHFYRDPEQQYIFLYEGTPASSSVAYNTKKLTNMNEIRSYWDILNPKWRGDIGFYSYGRGGSIPTPMLALYYNPKVGREFLKRLFEEMNLTISRDRRQATNWLARGKYTLCFMCRDTERAKRQGLPVEAYPADRIKEAGALGAGNSSVLAFLKNAPHPNAARVFINWFLSREGQMAWQRVMNTIVLEGSDSMRIDIPKDDVISAYRRAKGRDYPMLDFLDPRPVRKFYSELIHKAGKQKRRK